MYLFEVFATLVARMGHSAVVLGSVAAAAVGVLSFSYPIGVIERIIHYVKFLISLVLFPDNAAAPCRVKPQTWQTTRCGKQSSPMLMEVQVV